MSPWDEIDEVPLRWLLEQRSTRAGARYRRSTMARPTLTDLQEALLKSRPAPIPLDDGWRAFDAHKLLASQVHRASLLARAGDANETTYWISYVTQYFPAGRNNAADAKLLWKEWRTDLLKRDCPGDFVVMTHGKPDMHWQRAGNRLCIDLESMWDDFVYSVDKFIKYLANTPEREKITLQRLEGSSWTVQMFSNLSPPVSGASGMAIPLGSATVIQPNSS
ncbi:MAG TPA: hypothetical protein VGL68_02070 [Solirubrobacteraceae bacterium]